jgi:hypothetical protein
MTILRNLCSSGGRSLEQSESQMRHTNLSEPIRPGRGGGVAASMRSNLGGIPWDFEASAKGEYCGEES